MIHSIANQMFLPTNLIDRFNQDSDFLLRISHCIRPNLFVTPSSQSDTFTQDIQSLIDRIESNPVGNELLSKINSCATEIVICHGKVDCRTNDPLNLVVTTLQESECISTNYEETSLSVHVILFHELVHAYHEQINDMSYSNYHSDPAVWSDDEEYKTIMEENAFCREEHLPERLGHFNKDSYFYDFKKKRSQLLLINNKAKCDKPDLGPNSSWIFYVKYFSQIGDIREYILIDKEAAEGWARALKFPEDVIENEAYAIPHPTISLKSFLPWAKEHFKNENLKLVFLGFLRISESEKSILVEMSEKNL